MATKKVYHANDHAADLKLGYVAVGSWRGEQILVMSAPTGSGAAGYR